MGTAIGLDFGTTNSVVSYGKNTEKLRTFKVNGSPLIPSVLYFQTKDDYFIGQEAVNLSAKNPAAKISSFKLKLNEDNIPYIVTLEDGTTFRVQPKAAVRMFLNKLMTLVQNYLVKKFGTEDGLIDRAVITIPAKFKNTAVTAIKTAAASAMNLKVNQIKLVYEPTAAAVAALSDDDSDAERLLIYDFGGGTFDVSLIQKQNGVFKQIDTGGDANCGGDLLTNILAAELLNWANDEYGTKFPFDEMDFDEDLHGIDEEFYQKNLVAIHKEANIVKENLTDDSNVTSTFPFFTANGENENYIVDVSRKDFENMIREKINYTAEITRRIVEGDKAQEIGGIDKIILAGGSSQIPMIRDVLQEKLGRLDINYSDNVSTLISKGAAILAQNIESLESLTSQKTTVQLGIATTVGMQLGIFQTIIDEGQPLPCEGFCDLNLLEDNQQRLKITYYERDIKNFPDAKKIGDDGITYVDDLNVELPPNLKKADTTVRIHFRVNKDSSLEFSAKVLHKDGSVVGENMMKINKASELI